MVGVALVIGPIRVIFALVSQAIPILFHPLPVLITGGGFMLAMPTAAAMQQELDLLVLLLLALLPAAVVLCLAAAALKPAPEQIAALIRNPAILNTAR